MSDGRHNERVGAMRYVMLASVPVPPCCEWMVYCHCGWRDGKSVDEHSVVMCGSKNEAETFARGERDAAGNRASCDVLRVMTGPVSDVAFPTSELSLMQVWQVSYADCHTSRIIADVTRQVEVMNAGLIGGPPTIIDTTDREADGFELALEDDSTPQ